MSKWMWRNKTSAELLQVMVIVDGYAMVRHKGCAPFLMGLAQLLKDWEWQP